jgi:acetylserotonin N-methyltransferase
MDVSVFELPEVLADTRRYVGQRARLVGGDFFTSPLPPGDLYVLSKVLHNWSDERSIALLKRVFETLPGGGGLLVAERLLDEDRSGPAPVHLHSLNMLVSTGGRERTFSQYRTILHSAGFQDVEARRTGAITDAILASKPLGAK